MIARRSIYFVMKAMVSLVSFNLSFSALLLNSYHKKQKNYKLKKLLFYQVASLFFVYNIIIVRAVGADLSANSSLNCQDNHENFAAEAAPTGSGCG